MAIVKKSLISGSKSSTSTTDKRSSVSAPKAAEKLLAARVMTGKVLTGKVMTGKVMTGKAF